MLRVTTQHGTQYLIDTNNNKAMRVKADGRNDMYGDSDWFSYSYFCPLDRESLSYGDHGTVEIGKSIYFVLSEHREYDWRMSTKVDSVEEIGNA